MPHSALQPPTNAEIKQAWMEAAIAEIPQRYQAHARRVAPVLSKHHTQKEGFYNLLYDLTTPSQRLRSMPEVLMMALQFLEEQGELQEGDYINKLVAVPSPGTRRRSKPPFRGEKEEPTEKPKTPTTQWL